MGVLEIWPFDIFARSIKKEEQIRPGEEDIVGGTAPSL
jgi:hypothetical protein